MIESAKKNKLYSPFLCRLPHQTRGFPIDSSNNIAESANNAFKATMDRKKGTLEAITQAGLTLMEKQKGKVYL